MSDNQEPKRARVADGFADAEFVIANIPGDRLWQAMPVDLRNMIFAYADHTLEDYLMNLPRQGVDEAIFQRLLYRWWPLCAGTHGVALHSLEYFGVAMFQELNDFFVLIQRRGGRRLRGQHITMGIQSFWEAGVQSTNRLSFRGTSIVMRREIRHVVYGLSNEEERLAMDIIRNGHRLLWRWYAHASMMCIGPGQIETRVFFW